jgi:1-acyl-sn-glycerol-3-phosphate acyltransferase
MEVAGSGRGAVEFDPIRYVFTAWLPASTSFRFFRASTNSHFVLNCTEVPLSSVKELTLGLHPGRPLWVFMLEKWGNVKVKIYGEMLPQGDTMIGILNHTSDVDWIVGFAMCGRKCVLGALKVIVKTGHLIIPTFGMMEWFAEFIFVKRNWAEDRRQLEAGLDALVTYPKPFWFIVFPEGTRFSAARRDANNVWAAKNGECHHLCGVLRSASAVFCLLSIEALRVRARLTIQRRTLWQARRRCSTSFGRAPRRLRCQSSASSPRWTASTT